jgi:Ca2+-binding RTX toxin-like protein
MRKTILLLASMASAVLLASGVAWAITTIDCKASKSCQGTGGDDVITGTASRDVIIPYDGTDIVYADPPNKPLTNPPTFPKEGGNDDVRHSFGDDTIYGGGGNDTLRGGRGKDTIYGGPGKDLIDCAYLETRSGDTGDTAYYTPSEGDVVVDCKDKKLWDPTNPYDPNVGK